MLHMKLLLYFFVFITVVKGLNLDEVVLTDRVDHYRAEKRADRYDYIGLVTGTTSRYGSIAAWGFFGNCVIGAAADTYKAYDVCRQRVQNHATSENYDCLDQIVKAGRSTVYAATMAGFAYQLSVANKKREVDFTTLVNDRMKITFGENVPLTLMRGVAMLVILSVIILLATLLYLRII